MEPCFVEIREHLKAWLNDLLVYNQSENGSLEVLQSFFKVCRNRPLKISGTKTALFAKQDRWCERIISAEGVQFDLTRLVGLKDVFLPETAGDLCQYIHCLQWMPLTISDFSDRVALLRDVLEEAYVRSGKRTRKSIQRITLSQLSWGPAHVATFHSLQEQLRQSVTLSHRISDQALCVYSDVSDEHWAAVVTQCTPQELDKSSEKQPTNSYRF